MSIKIANLPVLGAVADARDSSSLTRNQMKAVCGGVDYSHVSPPSTLVIPPLFDGAQETRIDGIPGTVVDMIPRSPLYYFISVQ